MKIPYWLYYNMLLHWYIYFPSLQKQLAVNFNKNKLSLRKKVDNKQGKVVMNSVEIQYKLIKLKVEKIHRIKIVLTMLQMQL